MFTDVMGKLCGVSEVIETVELTGKKKRITIEIHDKEYVIFVFF